MSDKRLLILSLDDQAVAAIKKTAEDMGYTVSCLNNILDFYKIYESFKPTLLIIDMNLDEIDGIQLLTYLSTVSCKMQIIIMGKCDTKVLYSALNIGCQKKLSVINIIKLPITGDELRNIFNKIGFDLQYMDSSKIARAMELGQFVLHYQPKVNINTGRLMGMEVLIRWQPPNHSLLFPDSFISIAEESGLIVPMTYWIIKKSLEEYRTMILSNRNVDISINLSSKMLSDSVFPDEIIRLIKELKVDPSNICFEITESATMNQPDLALEILTRLRIAGFKLSIDDFGTGYSSLFELKRLPFTELKIDKSFIFDLAENQLNQSIVKSIAYLSHNLNMVLVAEGVESAQSFAILRKYNCDIAQGYFVSKGISCEAFIEFVNRNFNQDVVWHHFDKLE